MLSENEAEGSDVLSKSDAEEADDWRLDKSERKVRLKVED